MLWKGHWDRPLEENSMGRAVFLSSGHWCIAIESVCYWGCGYHRVTEWLRLGSLPPGQAGSPAASSPGPCPGGFSISERCRLHNLSVQLIPLLGQPHSYVAPEVQKFPWFSKIFHFDYGAETHGFNSFFLPLIPFKKIQLLWPQIWRDYLHVSLLYSMPNNPNLCLQWVLYYMRNMLW